MSKSTDFKDYYDKVYSKPYKTERWNPIYENIKGFLVGKYILDLGCGIGPLCEFEDRWEDYLGIDISNIAIDKARESFLNKSFIQADIEKYIYSNTGKNLIVKGYDIVTAIEVFEHVDFKKVISNLKPVEIIFSLPNYDSQSHLWFPTSTKELHEAFDPLIDFDIIHTFQVDWPKKIWICKGVIRGKNKKLDKG